MADSQFRCPLCHIDFDTGARIPRLVPSCGHTYCTSCLVELQNAHPNQLIVCPEDQILCQIKKPASQFPKNLALFTLIQKNASSQIGESGGSPSTGATVVHRVENLATQISSSDLCKLHKRKLEVICVSCKDRICTNCALFGKHKHHDIRMEEQIFKEISERADYLIEMYDVLEQQQIYFSDLSEIERLYLSFKTKQLELRKQVESRFKEIKTALKIQETKIHQTLETHFSEIEAKFVATRDVPKQILREVEEWKNATKNLLDQLTENTANPNYIAFELLESKVPEQNQSDLVTNGFALIERLENTSAMPSHSELGNLINQTKVHFNPEALGSIDNLCSVTTKSLALPKDQVKAKMVTPRAAKMINMGQQQGLLGSSQKSIKAQHIGSEIGEHSMIVDTGLASQDFLGEDADLLINMSFGGLEQQHHSSINESASTPSYTTKVPQEFPQSKHNSPHGSKKVATEIASQDQNIGLLPSLPEESSLVLTPPSQNREEKEETKLPPPVQDGLAQQVKVASSPKSKASDLQKQSSIESPISMKSPQQQYQTDEALVIQKASSEKVRRQELKEDTAAGSSQSLPVMEPEENEDEKVAQQKGEETKEIEQEVEFDLESMHPALKEIIENGGEIHDLSNQDLGDQGAKQLAMLMREMSLKTLNLSKNKITDIGARALFEALKESETVQTLNISYNGISEAAIEFISSAVRVNQSLKALILSQNQIVSRLAKNRLKQVSRSSLQIIF